MLNRRLVVSAYIFLILNLNGCTGKASETAQDRAGPTQAAGLDGSETSGELPDLRTRKTGSDWPGFLGPTHDSKSTEKFELKPWPEAGPPVVWTKKIGTSYGAPTVAQGRLFMFGRHGDSARLTCMNSETGAELWRFEYPTAYEDLYKFDNGPRTCPVVDQDRVYVFGAEGMLHCVSVREGKLIWKIDTSEQFNVVQNFFGVGSAPVIEEDLLLVAIGGSPPGSGADLISVNGKVQADGSGIVAFNKHTGAIVYKTSDELASYASPTLATINGRRWGFMFARAGLLGFEPQTGKIDFQFPWRAEILESVNAANPVIVGDNVFLSECYEPGSAVLKVRPGGYDVLWKDPRRKREKSMLSHWNTAIHHEGYLYGGHGRDTNGAELRCVELKTGKVMWSHRINERSSLLYVNQHLINLGEYGTLTLIRPNPEKPDILSSVKLTDEKGQELIEYPAWAAPVLSNGYLYLRGKDRLVCVDIMSEG